jgi:hypothetical protein
MTPRQRRMHFRIAVPLFALCVCAIAWWLWRGGRLP